jgi:hypothetical protein
MAGLLDIYPAGRGSPKPLYRLTDTALALLKAPRTVPDAATNALMEQTLEIARRQNARPGTIRVASAGVISEMTDPPEAVIHFRLLVKQEKQLALDLMEFTSAVGPLQKGARVSVVLERR